MSNWRVTKREREGDFKGDKNQRRLYCSWRGDIVQTLKILVLLSIDFEDFVEELKRFWKFDMEF